jgi:DNA-binding SARP family transcriptional activator
VATRIQLCGKVVVEVDGRRLEGYLPGRQGHLVLAYLAASRHRLIGRDELIDALWPYEAPADPAAALTVVLSKLRSVLGSKAIEGRSELRLSMLNAWVDLEAVQEAIHRAETAVSRADWAGAWGPGRVALHISRRAFLAGHDAPWIAEQRRVLGEIELRALRCVGETGLGLGGAELTTAERAARGMVSVSPFRETGYRLLMRALAEQGDNSEALRVYDELRTRLRDELGATPSRNIQELHRDLLRDRGRGRLDAADKVPERSV